MALSIGGTPRAARQLAQRATVTAFAVTLALLGMRIPLPFVDSHMFQNPGGILALGLAPLLSAFVIVEWIALALPPLRRLRNGSNAERLLLTRAAWSLALALAIVQSWGIVTFMRTVRGPTGDVLPPELLPAVAVGATLVAGAFLVGLAAAVVSQHGLGNGFAVIIAAGAIENLARAAAAPAMLYGGVVDLPPIVLDVIVLVVLASVMRWRRRRAQGEPFVPVPTCGLVPLQIAPYVLAIPFMLASWLPALARGAEALHVGSDAHSFVKLGLTVVLAILLARLFCSPAAVARAWARAAPASATPESAKAIGRALSQANRWSLLLVAVLAVLQTIGPVIVAVLDLAAIGAVLLDLAAEVRARSRATSLVAARPLHRVYAVEPALRALSEAGVSAFARTRYFRALYHFFAPYAPIEILVPAEQAEVAEVICARVVSDSRAA